MSHKCTACAEPGPSKFEKKNENLGRARNGAFGRTNILHLKERKSPLVYKRGVRILDDASPPKQRRPYDPKEYSMQPLYGKRKRRVRRRKTYAGHPVSGEGEYLSGELWPLQLVRVVHTVWYSD